MSTTSARFGLSILTEDDPWDIDQFAANWNLLDQQGVRFELGGGSPPPLDGDLNADRSQGSIWMQGRAVDISDGVNWLSLTSRQVFSVASYGAKGDGATDDTAAIQAAFDAAGSWHTGWRPPVPQSDSVVASGTAFANTYDTDRLRIEIWFPPGVYQISSALVLDFHHIAADVILSGPGAVLSPWMTAAGLTVLEVLGRNSEDVRVHTVGIDVARPIPPAWLLAATSSLGIQSLTACRNAFGSLWWSPSMVFDVKVPQGKVSWENVHVRNVGALIAWRLGSGSGSAVAGDPWSFEECSGMASQSVIEAAGVNIEADGLGVELRDTDGSAFSGTTGDAIVVSGNARVTLANVRGSGLAWLARATNLVGALTIRGLAISAMHSGIVRSTNLLGSLIIEDARVQMDDAVAQSPSTRAPLVYAMTCSGALVRVADLVCWSDMASVEPEVVVDGHGALRCERIVAESTAAHFLATTPTSTLVASVASYVQTTSGVVTAATA